MTHKLTSAFAVLLVGLCAQANAASIAISFAGDNGGGTSLNVDGGTAGVVQQSNWNNATGTSGGETDLVDETGTATTADVDWSSANTWGGTSWFTADEAVVNGWLDDGGDGSQVSFSEIPYARYDVYVYFTSDTGNDGRGAGVSVNGDVKTSTGVYTNLNVNQTFFNGLVDGESGAADPTYFVWRDISGDTLDVAGVRLIPNPDGPETRGSISGVQIVEVPEPSTVVLAGVALVGLGLLRRRR